MKCFIHQHACAFPCSGVTEGPLKRHYEAYLDLPVVGKRHHLRPAPFDKPLKELAAGGPSDVMSRYSTSAVEGRFDPGGVGLLYRPG